MLIDKRRKNDLERCCDLGADVVSAVEGEAAAFAWRVFWQQGMRLLAWSKIRGSAKTAAPPQLQIHSHLWSRLSQSASL